MILNSVSNYFHKGKKLTFKKGDVIINPEEMLQGVYFIAEGFVKAFSITQLGHEHLYIIYKPGEILPILLAFGGIKQNIFYQAITQVVAYRISKEELFQFLKKTPDAALEINKYIISIFEVYINRVDNLQYTQAYSRLVARLLFLAKRFGKFDGNSVIIEAPITHQDVANSINMSRETVSREFNILEKKRLVCSRKQNIIINDIHSLKKELELLPVKK